MSFYHTAQKRQSCPHTRIQEHSKQKRKYFLLGKLLQFYTLALNQKHNVAHKRLPYEQESDSDYTTTNNYVVRKSYDVKSRSTATLTPMVSGSNAADFAVSVALKEFSDLSELKDSDYVGYDKKEGITESSKPTENTVTILPILQGITAVRYKAKSSAADTPSSITVHYRGHA